MILDQMAMVNDDLNVPCPVMAHGAVVLHGPNPNLYLRPEEEEIYIYNIYAKMDVVKIFFYFFFGWFLYCVECSVCVCLFYLFGSTPIFRFGFFSFFISVYFFFGCMCVEESTNMKSNKCTIVKEKLDREKNGMKRSQRKNTYIEHKKDG